MGPSRPRFSSLDKFIYFFLLVVKKSYDHGPPSGMGPRQPHMAAMGQGRPYPHLASPCQCLASPILPPQQLAGTHTTLVHALVVAPSAEVACLSEYPR
jgi:hypothetical protein